MNDDSPSRPLAGAHRLSGNPRIHALKPYARPASISTVPLALAGPSSPTKSPTKALPASSTRLPRHESASSLPRSGSESSLSLVSGIKSIFTRPLAWLATPSRATTSSSGAAKRDSFSSFGNERDVEADGDIYVGAGGAGWSPSDRPAAAKRARRHSPGKVYEPDNAIGRAVSGFMLPPLPPHVSLAKHAAPGSASKARAPPSATTNYARPLTGSTSMPYLDPPLSGSPARTASLRRAGPLTRSRRVDLTSLAAEPAQEEQEKEERVKDVWSPWKEKAVALAGRRSMTPQRTRAADARELALPSLSPFRAPPSPSTSRHGASGLTRSVTMTNVVRRASVVSDVSMGLGRAGSARLPHGSSTLRLSAVADDRTDRMSVDGERGRDGSVLQDWFMQDRWNSPSSPVSLTGSRRHGSAAPAATALPPIRKGQMVWDADKGFVRQSELQAEVPKPVQQNDAERILFALESMRKAPLIDASQTRAPIVNSLPAELVGSSSRSIRRAIAVPLATAQAEENVRKAGAAAVARRNPSNWDPEASVSNMISPYGRRKHVERAAREERRERTASELRSERPNSVSTDVRSERSERASRSASRDERMSVSEPSTSPQPQATPRRSTRNRKAQPEPDEEPTPRPAKRGTRRTTAKEKEAEPEPARRSTRSSRRKAASPRPAEREKTPPAPAVPTITETAPSPSSNLELPARSSTYEIRSDDAPRERDRSSLRARSEMKHRSHQGAASYASSRATSPNGGGRFSARDEDLPTMEELEQAKIPLVSFAGIKMPLLSTAPSPVPPAAADNRQAETPSLASRIGAPAMASQPAAPAAPSLAVPPATGLARPLGRVGTLSTRPRASSPLAAHSIVPDPDSPPAAPKAGAQPSTTPASKPPAFSFSAPSAAPANGAKPTFTFGLGKPPAPAATPAPELAAGGGVPDFFGRSNPASGTTTPTAAPPVKPFDFGLSKPAEAPQPVVSTFSLGAAPAVSSTSSPAANGDAPATSAFSFGKPASAAGSASTSLFGSPAPDAAPKAAEPAKATFSFGAPAAGTPAEPAKASGGVSFGASAADKPAEAPKGAFSFGAPADKPADKPTSSFSFGQPAKPTEPAAAVPMFSFGSSTPAAEATQAKAADKAKASFSFGASTATPAAADKPAEPNRFTFGAAPASNGAVDKPAGFSFTTPSSPAPTAAAANPFGAATNGTANGASTVAPPSGFGSGFSFAKLDAKAASPAAPAPASPFGAPGGFNFAAPAPASASASASSAAPASAGFGQAAASPAVGAKPFSFGTSTPSSTPPAPGSGFTFGATTTSSNGPAPGFGTGAAAASTPGTPAFTFGSAPAANGAGSQPFAFGGSGSQTQTQTQPPPSPFGQQQPASPFGQPGANPFASAASTPATTPAAAPGGFTFGSTPAASALANNNPFGAQPQPQQAAGFGAPAAQGQGVGAPAPAAQGFGVTSPPAATTPAFTFGAAPGPSTPTGAPAQPFQFGAGAGATAPAPAPAPVFAFGSPAPANPAARFGSPAPSDGGFSMGVAGDAPASPSGRKIKPLRRGAVKR
ncbi:hypothetical protein Q5752_002110 [Cryptotrichosporon argae]